MDSTGLTRWTKGWEINYFRGLLVSSLPLKICPALYELLDWGFEIWICSNSNLSVCVYVLLWGKKTCILKAADKMWGIIWMGMSSAWEGLVLGLWAMLLLVIKLVHSLQKYGTSPYYFLIILTKQEDLIRRIFESKLEIF